MTQPSIPSSSPHHSPSATPACPTLAKGGFKELPISMIRDLFFFLVCYSILQRERSRDCGRKLPLQAAKPLIRGNSSLPSHGQPSSHSLCLTEGKGSQPILGHLPKTKLAPATSVLFPPCLIPC